MSGKPSNEDHVAAAGGWTVGDRVTARANPITVPAGSRGTVIGFSEVGGHPLVDFAGAGLVIIRAEHLTRDDEAPLTRPSSDTTRLSATPQPPPVQAAQSPPSLDWFDRPPSPATTDQESAPDHADESREEQRRVKRERTRKRRGGSG